MDARRTSTRTLKRKAAWAPSAAGGEQAPPLPHAAQQPPQPPAQQPQQQQPQHQQQHQQQAQHAQQQARAGTPTSQGGARPGRAPPQMLSPPDMVWPANPLAQVPASVCLPSKGMLQPAVACTLAPNTVDQPEHTIQTSSGFLLHDWHGGTGCQQEACLTCHGQNRGA